MMEVVGWLVQHIALHRFVNDDVTWRQAGCTAVAGRMGAWSRPGPTVGAPGPQLKAGA